MNPHELQAQVWTLQQRVEELEAENVRLRGNRRRWCPLCGATENRDDKGGTEACFHCACGWLQCKRV